ncbi:MAG: GTP cyclohydrolase FolE2 [Anaerolineae bacterium]|nr:GTP cyclohydrolase FolE2 [Anaerolineae bacterium]MCO5191395.1 GTP cyclohydrolase FolE2 [Anaerolineae bacterium]
MSIHNIDTLSAQSAEAENLMKENGIYTNGNGVALSGYANGKYTNGHSNGAVATKTPGHVPYDTNFVVTPEYKASLPDLQNGPESLIKGSRVAIQQVGIHNFRLPINYLTKDGGSRMLETSVSGTVSLEAHKKGINMSRIMRTFYEHQNETFSLDMLEDVLQDYRDNLESLDARLMLRFSYPIMNQSLRSGLLGYQYYEVAFEARMDRAGNVQKFIHFDFVYSSTCPCSYELSQHAINTRGVPAVPHSQRSVARVSVELNDFLWIEDLRDLCLDALKTETQVMVKREDEQAFAEMNAAYLKFVEDAVRLVYEQLDDDPRIRDFKVIASHQESLHSHDAVSVIVKGIEGGFSAEIEPSTLTSLIHKI